MTPRESGSLLWKASRIELIVGLFPSAPPQHLYLTAPRSSIKNTLASFAHDEIKKKKREREKGTTYLRFNFPARSREAVEEAIIHFHRVNKLNNPVFPHAAADEERRGERRKK